MSASGTGRYRKLLVVCLALLALLAVGCGGSGGSSATSAPKTAPPAAAPAPTSQAQAPAKVPTPAPAPAPKPMEVKKLIATVPTLSASQWDYYVADAKGFFKDYKLDVQRVVAESNTKAVQALIAGSAHVASGSPDAAIRAISGGAKIVVVGANTSKPVYSLMAAQGITDFAQVKGQRAGVSGIASMDAVFMKQIMAKYGLKDGDYQMIEVGGTAARMAALQAKGIAVGLLNQPDDFKAMRIGMKRLALSTEVPSDVTWSAFTMSQDWAKANEDTAVRFMAAIRKAHLWLWDKNNRKEAAAILAKETNTEQVDSENTYDLWIGGNALTKEGEVTLDGMTNMTKALNEQKLLTGPIDPKTTFDLSYLDKARKL